MITGELTPIRVAGVPEHFNLPWMLALERRAFVRAGVDVQWRTVPEGTGAMCNLLRAGEVDLALLVTEGAVRDILDGAPCRIIAPFVDSPLTWGVHVGSGSSIEKPEQLRGLPFVISQLNSGSHLAALTYARGKGWVLNEKDLVVVNDLKGALAQLAKPEPMGFLWEKFTTKPHVDTGVLRRVDEYRTTWPSFMLVGTEAVLQAHPKEIGRLLKVLRDQAAGVMAKRTAPEMIAHRYGLSLSDAQEWFATVRWNSGAPIGLEALRAVVKTLDEAGSSSATASMEDLLAKLLWQPVEGHG